MAFRSQVYVHLYPWTLKRWSASMQHCLQKCSVHLDNGGLEKQFLHCSACYGDVVEDSSLLVSKRGEIERLTELLDCCLKRSGVAKVESTFLCVLPMWIFKPFSDLKLFSHWAHWKTFSSSGSVSFSTEGSFSGGVPAMLLGQKLCSPPGISSLGWWTLPLLRQFCRVISPGVQGKWEGRANIEGEAEGLSLAGQRLAESHTLGGQVRVVLVLYTSNLWRI